MTLQKLLSKHENLVLLIKRRLYFLEAFEQGLQKIASDKPYLPRNDIVYALIFDSWDMLVIDIASLCKDMLGRGGFFNILKNHVNQLKPSKKAQYTAPEPMVNYIGQEPTIQQKLKHKLEMQEEFLALLVKNNHDAFYRLFPNSKGRQGRLKHEDVDDLIKQFEDIAGPFIADRNKHRAHRYERREMAIGIKSLDIKEISQNFERLEKILNDIRLVSELSTFAYNDMNFADSKATADDLIFLILVGSLKRGDEWAGINSAMNKDDGLPKKYGYQFREQYYDTLHDQFDKYYSLLTRTIASTAKSYDDIKVPKMGFNDPTIKTKLDELVKKRK